MDNEIIYSDKLSYLKLTPDEGKISKVKEHFCVQEDNDQKTDWSKSVALKDIFPFLKFIHDNGDSLIIGFELYNFEPLTNYPSNEEVEREIRVNKQRNQEIHNQQKEDLKELGIDMDNSSSDESDEDEEMDDELAEAFGGFVEELFVEEGSEMAFPTNHGDCIVEMKGNRLVESVEELMSKILDLAGVDEAGFSFRNSMIDIGEEIYTVGSSEDGVYTCSRDKLSNIKEW